MIPIKKSPSPKELEKLRREATQKHLSPEEAYKTLSHPLKATILEQLIQEQGHLCAYCMRRIPDERDMPATVQKASIEHFYPLNPISHEDREQGLDYQNMLAVCSGNRGLRHTRKRKDFTCDARRNSKSILTVIPINKETLSEIYYHSDGRIAAYNSTIDNDLNNELNLNCTADAVQLPYQRKNALVPLLDEIEELILHFDREVVRQFCATRLQQFEDETVPKSEYVGILIWWLKDYIKGLDASLIGKEVEICP